MNLYVVHEWDMGDFPIQCCKVLPVFGNVILFLDSTQADGSWQSS